MRRRDFIAAIGSAPAAWPVAANAQQRALPVVGVLGDTTIPVFKKLFASVFEGLGQTGYIEGRNVTIEYSRRRADDFDHLRQFVAELVGRRVAVIFAGSADFAAAAKAATTTIPIVFLTRGDPVEMGLVASLNRPGGNITGATILSTETTAKMMEMLHEAAPEARLAAALVHPNSATREAFMREAENAARILGLEFRAFDAASVSEIDSAFASLQARNCVTPLSQLPPPLVLIEGDGFLLSRIQQIALLSARHGIPTIFPTRDFPEAGGLMSYGGNNLEGFRIAGAYIGRILKGEKPADLPVQRVTKVELVINMNATKVLGLTLPLSLLGRADEVIE